MLDNFPQTEAQAALMRRHAVVPNEVFSLALPGGEALYENLKDRYLANHQADASLWLCALD